MLLLRSREVLRYNYLMYIPIILGTAREGRRSEKAAQFVLRELQKQPDVETEIIDVRDYRLGATDDSGEQETAKKYIQKVTAADGFIIVSPEYNHGYPGELKMMLDMAYKEYNKKPVAICGVSNGGMGGVRMTEQLRLVAIELQMVPISKAVYFSNVKTLFDEQGNITDESYYERLKKVFEELLWYTKAL
jgi:NAD(P)H-dependent FMN reductase